MSMSVHISGKGRQRGVGMVEILVALLVMSIGLLGYAGLQLRALGSTEDAHYRTQAISLAQDLSERIAANPQSLADYTTAGSWEAQVAAAGKPAGWDDCVDNNCDPAAMAANDILQVSWQSALLLPGGQVLVADCPVSAAVCVTVTWDETTPATCAPPGDDCVRLEVVAWTPPAP